MPSSKGKDFLVSVDKRLQIHNFHGRPPESIKKPPLDIVSTVFDSELKNRFKTIEDRLMFRLDTWISTCAVSDTCNEDHSGQSKKSKNRRFVKSQQSFSSRLRSKSFSRLASRSLNNLDAISPDISVDLNEQTRSGKFPLPAYSTPDLFKARENELVDVANKYGTLPRKKVKRFLFFKKKEKAIYTDDSLEKQKNESPTMRSRIKGKKKDNLSLQTGVGKYSSTGSLPIKSATPKMRPSIFDIDAFVNTEQTIEQPLHRPASRKKFNTVTVAIGKGNHYNDSFRFYSHLREVKSSTNGKMHMDQIFYHPKPAEADIGQI